ncbi:MAG: hypothetical protein EG825_05685 [Rhodocyclaceae bacterium]|nr:hypothetical protein [Rhodocyclaceae bacterium]
MSNDELPRDAELSALYREAADAMPPPALDRRILAAAEAAIKPAEPVPSRRRPWWLRFAAPMGVFATLVLTVTVVMLVEHEQQDLLPRGDDAPAPAAAPAPVQDAVPASSDQKKEKVAASPQTLPVQKSSPKPADTPAASMSPASGTGVMPSLERRSAAESAGVAPSRDEAKVLAPSPAAPSTPSVAPTPPAQPATSPATSSGELSSRPPAAAPAPMMLERAAPVAKSQRGPASANGVTSSTADQVPRSPEAWVAEIRRLIAEGREAEAREQLERFRKTYPGFVLPADLR